MCERVDSLSAQASVAASLLISFLKDAGYRFITPTPATHLRVNGRAESQRAETLADAFGWNRPFAGGLIPNPLLQSLKEEGLVVEAAAGLKSIFRVSTLDDDLLLHSSFPTIAQDAVFFGPDTYRFARAIKCHLKDRPVLGRALDLGCGSGAGGVALARSSMCKELMFSDINEAALRVAALNAGFASLGRVATVRSNLFANIEGMFDLIVSNPPYLNDPLERAYRHGGGELGSGLSIRIAKEATDRLTPGGSLVMYTGSPIVRGVDRLRHAIEENFAGRDLRWAYEEIDPDVFGEELETAAYKHVDRIAAVVLTATRREGL